MRLLTERGVNTCREEYRPAPKEKAYSSRGGPMSQAKNGRTWKKNVRPLTSVDGIGNNVYAVSVLVGGTYRRLPAWGLSFEQAKRLAALVQAVAREAR